MRSWAGVSLAVWERTACGSIPSAHSLERLLGVHVECGLEGPSSCSWVQLIAEVDEQHVACILRRIAGQTGCGSSERIESLMNACVVLDQGG